MKTLQLFTIIVLSAFVFFGMGHPVQALTIVTDVMAVSDPPTGIPSLDGDSGSSGTVLSSVGDPNVGINWTVGAHAAAAGNEDGVVAAKAKYLAWDGSSINQAESSVFWSQTYTRDISMSTWDFNISGGELSIMDWAGVNMQGPAYMYAHYEIGILLNGSLIWDSSADLSGGSAEHIYTTSGTDLGGESFGLYPTYAEGYFGYRYDSYNDSIDLSSIGIGESFTLSYGLMVAVSGPGFETGANAWIGDPFDLAQGGGLSGQFSGGGGTQPPIPEPSTVLLLGVGLIGLIGLGRKKSAQK